MDNHDTTSHGSLLTTSFFPGHVMTTLADHMQRRRQVRQDVEQLLDGERSSYEMGMQGSPCANRRVPLRGYR